MNGIVGRWC